MFAPLPTPKEMAAWDRAAVNTGIPEMLLMEHAGKGAATVLNETFGSVAGKRVLLFMGAGNNGGDAACMARHLFDAKACVLVLHTRPLNHYQGVTAQHLRMAQRCGVPFASSDTLTPQITIEGHVPDVVVDGLLGTGFSGTLREREASLVEAINRYKRQGCFILSLDIPSGLDGLTGRPCPTAVTASATATFAAAKPGLVMPEACAYTGSLHICDIAMPRKVQESLPPSYQMMLPAVLEAPPIPGRSWYKGKAGHVLVAGGSAGLTGAPHLSARGALRAGAGLVSVAAPEPFLQEIKGLPDIMAHSLGKAWDKESGSRLAEILDRINRVVIGPGMGRSKDAMDAVASLLALPQRPSAVIDADALFALSVRRDLFSLLREDDILTPHPGEAALLLDYQGSASVQENRLESLERLTELSPSIWVLKGAGTLVGRRGDVASLCPLSAPNLSVGGAGDVLSGCLGALAGQDIEPMLAACCGVYLHARAGMLLAEKAPRRGNLASEIADALPGAW